jgi:aminopeptidase N
VKAASGLPQHPKLLLAVCLHLLGMREGKLPVAEAKEEYSRAFRKVLCGDKSTENFTQHLESLATSGVIEDIPNSKKREKQQIQPRIQHGAFWATLDASTADLFHAYAPPHSDEED